MIQIEVSANIITNNNKTAIAIVIPGNITEVCGKRDSVPEMESNTSVVCPPQLAPPMNPMPPAGCKKPPT